ncbi:hypothetical protein AMJ82_10835 [candidate division TA06 bacterium SM23_40]|uniref:Uncharacterized protein n=1 Tax=candidate division TA06 bacterium SM23_40 TaxID=1703774 RepID=A0A0S8G3B4_UNCT6|nr:MAG: hypothetical protein AMJ82_10835 [candidate division TA06 bacterium SM23_40]
MIWGVRPRSGTPSCGRMSPPRTRRSTSVPTALPSPSTTPMSRVVGPGQATSTPTRNSCCLPSSTFASSGPRPASMLAIRHHRSTIQMAHVAIWEPTTSTRARPLRSISHPPVPMSHPAVSFGLDTRSSTETPGQ